MEQKYCNTKRKKYTHISESERYKIEVYLEQNMSPEIIAQKLRRAKSTIYREIARGSVPRLDSLWREKINTEPIWPKKIIMTNSTINNSI